MSVFLTAKLLKVICSDKDYADLYNLLAPKTYEMAYTSTFSAPRKVIENSMKNILSDVSV